MSKYWNTSLSTDQAFPANLLASSDCQRGQSDSDIARVCHTSRHFCMYIYIYVCVRIIFRTCFSPKPKEISYRPSAPKQGWVLHTLRRGRGWEWRAKLEPGTRGQDCPRRRPSPCPKHLLRNLHIKVRALRSPAPATKS